MMHKWSVHVGNRFIGYVDESTEEYARCAALHHYGIADDEWAESDGSRELFGQNRIRPNEEFSVFRRS